MIKFLIISIILTSSLSFADIGGTYQVTRSSGCPMFISKGSLPIKSLEVDTEVDLKLYKSDNSTICDKDDLFGTLNIYSTGSEQTLILYKKGCKDRFKKKYYKKGKFNVSKNNISFNSKGSILSTCDSFAGISHPCLKSWDESWSIKLRGDKLLYSWSVSGKSGRCELDKK